MEKRKNEEILDLEDIIDGDLLYADPDDITDDDRLWAALSWLQIIGVWPFVSLALLLLPQTRERPFIRYNALLSLLAMPALIVLTILSCGLGALGFLGFFFWAARAYQGYWVQIPLLSNWLVQMGWVPEPYTFGKRKR